MKNPISTFIQNWQVKTATSIFTGPAILLAFFFTSCEEPIEVESDLVPGGNNTEIRYVEFPLEMSHTAFDSLIISSNEVEGARGQIFVGHQNSPEIGDFSASAYFGAILDQTFNRDSLTLDAQVIETRLSLGLNYFHGDDFDLPQKFIVYQLQDTLDVSDDYTIYDSFVTEEVISLDTSIVINPVDTIAEFVPLNNGFGSRVLDFIRIDDLSVEELYNALRGFKIETEAGTNNLQGMSIAGGDAYIEVIYKKPNVDSVESVILNLSGSSFSHINFSPGSLIPTDYSSKKSFELTDPSKAYFNNIIGISPRISLANYLSFMDTVNYMQINKAELVIKDENFSINNSESVQLQPANNIVPYILNQEGEIEKEGEDFWALQSNFNLNGGLADPTEATSPISLGFDPARNEIRGDISFFLQEIYNNPSFWNEENSFMFTGQFIRRNERPFNETPIINVGNFNNFLVDKENITLRIYYTTFK